MPDNQPKDDPIPSPTASPTAAQETPTESVAQPIQRTAPPPQSSLFQGRYKSPEEGFWHLKGQLDALQTRPADTKPESKPQFTTDQLWTLRAQKLTEMVAAQAAGEGDKAATLAANVNWIDSQIQEQRFTGLRKEVAAQTAIGQLASEGADLLKPYQGDLTPGNPLYETAQTYYAQIKQALEAGLPIDNVISGLVVLAAAAKTGKSTAGVAQQARQEFAGAMQQALKQAVVTGAGAVGKAAEKTPDFLNMTDDEFRAYERKIGMRS